MNFLIESSISHLYYCTTSQVRVGGGPARSPVQEAPPVPAVRRRHSIASFGEHARINFHHFQLLVRATTPTVAFLSTTFFNLVFIVSGNYEETESGLSAFISSIAQKRHQKLFPPLCTIRSLLSVFIGNKWSHWTTDNATRAGDDPRLERECLGFRINFSVWLCGHASSGNFWMYPNI